MKKQMLALAALMLAGQGASAVKMCAARPSYNDSGITWKVGEGCVQYSQDSNVPCYPVWIRGDGGFGESDCNEGDEFDAIPSEGSGSILFCRRLLPIASKYICMGRYNSASPAGWQCSSAMGNKPKAVAKLLTQFW